MLGAPTTPLFSITDFISFEVNQVRAFDTSATSDLPLNFHPAAARASASFALRPIFGSPEARFFRLAHGGGLAAPT
jgi:hypothetical protein